MLQVTIPGIEYYNESTETFEETKSQTLQLEHSLISVSKWESKWKKAFLSDKQRSLEESTDYIKCMTLTQNVNQECYNNITQELFQEINKYIDDSMTATSFSHGSGGGKARNQTVTAEIVYYWMISFNIPFECQKWHLNRLMALIQVCSIKQENPKKMSRQRILQENTAMNEARKKELQTSG